jgi:hypothetical protein
MKLLRLMKLWRMPETKAENLGGKVRRETQAEKLGGKLRRKS